MDVRLPFAARTGLLGALVVACWLGACSLSPGIEIPGVTPDDGGARGNAGEDDPTFEPSPPDDGGAGGAGAGGDGDTPAETSGP